VIHHPRSATDAPSNPHCRAAAAATALAAERTPLSTAARPPPPAAADGGIHTSGDDARALLSDSFAILGAVMPERPWALKQAAYIDIESTHTQAWLAWDPDTREVRRAAWQGSQMILWPVACGGSRSSLSPFLPSPPLN
jgi:hypothetical protein